MKKKNILFVDKDKTFFLILKERLEKIGYQVSYTATAQTALRNIRKGQRQDLIVFDVGSGQSGLKQVGELAAQAPVVVLTNLDSARICAEAFRRAAVDYILKETAVDDIVTLLTGAIKARSKRGES